MAKKYANSLEQQKAWREANKERVKATAKAWWENNKDKYPKSTKPKKQKVYKITPIVKAELDFTDIFYIKNHIEAGIPFEVIANRACCDISDIERIAKRRESDAHIQNIG
jgi:hypothetical protein